MCKDPTKADLGSPAGGPARSQPGRGQGFLGNLQGDAGEGRECVATSGPDRAGGKQGGAHNETKVYQKVDI